MSNIDDRREQAIHRLKAKQQFWWLVTVWVGVSALCVVIWLLTGRGFFWPVWPMFGMAIGVAAAAWRAFGPGAGGMTEAQIQAEMKRMDGS